MIKSSNTIKNDTHPINSLKRFDENYELPENYDLTQICLIARDPYWIYAYWELAQLGRDYLRKKFKKKRLNGTFSVRIYDVTCVYFDGSNANHQFDIDIDIKKHQDRYIHVWKDNASYCAELGYQSPGGEFTALARSNIIHTQRAGLASNKDVKLVQPVEQNNSVVLSEASFSRKTSNRVKEKQTHKPKKYPVPKPNEKKRSPYGDREPLAVDQIWGYYSKLIPLMRQIHLRRPGIKSAYDETLPDINPYDLGEPLLTRQFKQYKFLSGSDEILDQFKGGSEQVSEKKQYLGASEEISSQPDRKFFFEIGTELVVFGRTDPKASVYLKDKKIPLRSDGTFTMRFSLPEGEIPLDFTAQSHDKLDKRTIQTKVTRSNTKHNS